MFLVEAGGLSALYTGDFTTVPDHHLSAARVPLGLRPDVMITETTCCTTVRSSKRMKEYELCCKVQEPTPAVVLAGPAMLDAGSSLQIFKRSVFRKWSFDCEPAEAKSKQIELDEEIIRVKCEVETVSHSDHTDSRGILELIAQTSPQQVVLVHGAEPLMKSFQPIVTRRLKLPCYSPANDLQEALSIVGHENPLEGEGPWDLNIGGLSCKVGKEAAAFVVTVLWDRKAEAEVPKLSTFLEALGAGGLGARG
eukprot:g30060.t1